MFMQPQEDTATTEKPQAVPSPPQKPVAPKRKIIHVVLIIAAILALVGLGVFAFLQHRTTKPKTVVTKTPTKSDYRAAYDQTVKTIEDSLSIDAGTYVFKDPSSENYFKAAKEKTQEYKTSAATLRTSLKTLYAKDAIVYDKSLQDDKALFENNMNSFLDSVDQAVEGYGILQRDYGDFTIAYAKGRNADDWSLRLRAVTDYNKVLQKTKVREKINAEYLEKMKKVMSDNAEVHKRYIATDSARKAEVEVELTEKYKKINTTMIAHLKATLNNVSRYSIDGGQAGGLQIALFKKTLEANTPATALTDKTALTRDDYKAVREATLNISATYSNNNNALDNTEYTDVIDNTFRRTPQKLSLDLDAELRAIGNLKAVQLDTDMQNTYRELLTRYQKNINSSVVMSEFFTRDIGLVHSTLKDRDPATVRRYLALYDTVARTLHNASTRKYITDAKPYIAKVPDLLTRCQKPNNDESACEAYSSTMNSMFDDMLANDAKSIENEANDKLAKYDFISFSTKALDKAYKI